MNFLDCDDEKHLERYEEIYVASWQLANKFLYKFLSNFQLTPFHFNSRIFFLEENFNSSNHCYKLRVYLDIAYC